VTEPPVSPSSSSPTSPPPLAAGPDLTLRAVLAGLVLGAVLSVANVYIGLKSNFWDSGNLTAAVLAFALCAPGARLRGRPYSLLENNITQTMAGSAASMPATLGILGALPALELLGHHYPTWGLAAWGLALALFGILLAVPLRQRYVVNEPLPFPSAIATAEVMRAMHSSSEEARARTRVLLVVAVVALLITWFRDGRPAVVPGVLWLPLQLAGASAQSLTLGMAVSPALLGAGILAGGRAGLSLLGGAVIAWGILGPGLIRAGVARAEYVSLVSWLLWPGMALMVAAGLVALAVRWRSFARVFSRLGGLQPASGGSGGGLALVLSGAAVVLVAWLVFGVHPALGALSVLISVALIDVCVRTAGETDIAPLTAVGQLAQMLLGLLGPGRAPVNVACAQVSAGAGAQAAVTTSVLRTGYLLGAPQAGQLRAQMLGAVVGLLTALPTYALVKSTHGIGTERLPAPGALPWKALAELTERGAAALPPGAGLAALLGAAVGVVLSLLERSRVARFTPSPMALALAFMIPGTAAGTIALGAVVALTLQRRQAGGAESISSSTAAGGIAGESLMVLAVAILTAVGALGGG
jgi:uncharacterized oligopeptide transporter (OPT) family protein